MFVDMFDRRWPEVDAVNKIRERSILHSEALDTWSYEKFDYTGINQYKKISEGVIHFDEMWDTQGTYFFEREVFIPTTSTPRDWYIEFDLDGECEVYLDGVASGSLDVEHHEVMIARQSLGNRTVSVKIQATRHAHDFVRSKRGFGKEYGYHIFKKAQLVARQQEMVAFCCLTEVALQFVVCDILREEIREQLHEIIKSVLYDIDYYGEQAQLEEQVLAGKQVLLEKIRALPIDLPFEESYFMGHSHLDLAFKWSYKETYRKMERTLSNTVCLMDRYPNVTYTQSQMHIFETIAKGYPQLFERIQKHVATGKLEVVGDTYVEFDTNLPSGESIIRQFLYGKQIANEWMGTDSQVCFLPDTFGYSGILPQILKQAGFQYFVTAKLSWNDTNQPKDVTFLWKGIDGSSIKSHLIDSYAGKPNPGRLASIYKDERRKRMPNHQVHICQYGAGDGGGGISEEDVLTIQAMDELQVFTQVKQTTLQKACEDIFRGVSKEDLPLREGELYFEKHRGVYTSQEKIKKGNRKLELALQKTEALNTLFYLQGGSYDQERYDAVWKKLLLNQFHDIISGTSIQEVIHDAAGDYAEGMATCDKIRAEILQEVSQKEDCITVFNPIGVEMGGMAVISLPYPVQTVSGQPVQMIDRSQEDKEGYWGLVKVDAVPAFGHRKLILGERIQEEEKFVPQAVTVLENSRYRIVFDDQGEITSLLDKRQQREVLRGKGNVLCAHVDRGGYFEAWDITGDMDRKVFTIDTVTRMELVEDGALRKTLQIEKTFRNSKIVQKIRIYEDSARIDFDTTTDWQEPQMLLKAGFAVDVDAPMATYDISLGNLERETTRNNSYEKAKFEVLTHKFVDLSEDTHGVAIFNDCKYGCDVAGHTMRITLLKTANFPDETQDIGVHSFSYSVFPHAGNFKLAKVREEAYLFNQPFYAVAGAVNLPEAPFCYQEEGVMLETVKKAQKEEAVILRFYEHHGKAHEFTVTCANPVKKVALCTVLEQETNQEILAEGSTFSLSLKPYEISTVKIML